MEREPIPGCDKFLYDFRFLKNGKVVHREYVIAFSKFDAYCDCKFKGDYDVYDYTHIRPAYDYEELGIIKNPKL